MMRPSSVLAIRGNRAPICGSSGRARRVGVGCSRIDPAGQTRTPPSSWTTRRPWASNASEVGRSLAWGGPIGPLPRAPRPPPRRRGPAAPRRRALRPLARDRRRSETEVRPRRSRGRARSAGRGLALRDGGQGHRRPAFRASPAPPGPEPAVPAAADQDPVRPEGQRRRRGVEPAQLRPHRRVLDGPDRRRLRASHRRQRPPVGRERQVAGLFRPGQLGHPALRRRVPELDRSAPPGQGQRPQRAEPHQPREAGAMRLEGRSARASRHCRRRRAAPGRARRRPSGHSAPAPGPTPGSGCRSAARAVAGSPSWNEKSLTNVSCSSSNGTAAIVRPSGLMATKGGRSTAATASGRSPRDRGTGDPGAASAPRRRAVGRGGPCPRGSPGIRPRGLGISSPAGGISSSVGSGVSWPCSMVKQPPAGGVGDDAQDGAAGRGQLAERRPRHGVDQGDAGLIGQEHGQVVARHRHRAAGGARAGPSGRRLAARARPVGRRRGRGARALGRQRVPIPGPSRPDPARRPPGLDPPRSGSVINRRPCSTSHSASVSLSSERTQSRCPCGPKVRPLP